MADVSEFDLVGTEKFEDDAVGSIHSKAPHFVLLGVQLLGMEGWVKGIGSKEIGLGGGFSLNGLGKFLEQLLEGRGRREFEHDRSVDQLPQRLPLRDASGAMIFFRRVQGLQEFPAVETDRIAKGFEVLPGNFELKTVLRSFHNFCG